MVAPPACIPLEDSAAVNAGPAKVVQILATGEYDHMILVGELT